MNYLTCRAVLKLLLCILLGVTTVFCQEEKDIETIMREEREKIKKIQDETLQYRQQVGDEMKYYQEQISREYEAVERRQRQLLDDMKQEIQKKWEEFRYDSKEEVVDYDKDLNARGSVNFKKGVVEVEVIADAADPKSKQKAEKRIQEKLKDLVKKIAEDRKPLLENQLRTKSGKKVSASNVNNYSKEIVSRKHIESKKYKSRDGKTRVKYSVKVSMVPNHIEVRASRFKEEVLKQSKRFKIDPRVAFAVMHSESYFNPRARSYVPAYGLMQLVPKSGARDAYIYIYKRDKLLRANYLYNPQNNIELGCAYLSKIRHVYFGNIKDDKKAYYCAICAYNTGPGNVAKALTGTKKLGSANAIVNSHSAEWVYKRLQRNLPYSETKKYLKNVTERTKIYEGWM